MDTPSKVAYWTILNGVTTEHCHDVFPLKDEDLNKITFSFMITSRGRAELLKESLYQIYSKARNPRTIECFVATDDDDSETINFFKTDDEIFKNNIRTFTAPRVGYSYQHMFFKNFYPMTSGDIIIPWADDNIMYLKNWDDAFLPHRTKSALVGWKGRFALTRRSIEELDLVRNFIEAPLRGGDSKLWWNFSGTEFYIHIPKWWHRRQPGDQTKREHRWTPKNEVLDGFKITEIARL